MNHLSHFLLIHLLFSKLQASRGGSRVINLSSRAHLRHGGAIDYSLLKAANAQNYDGWHAYGRSKLSNILCAKALAKRYPVASSGISFFSLHPGLVATELLTVGGMNKSQGMPVSKGIKCTLHLCTSPEVAGQSGEYYHNEELQFFLVTSEKAVSIMSDIAQSEGEADACFDMSMGLLRLDRFA